MSVRTVKFYQDQVDSSSGWSEDREKRLRIYILSLD